MPSERPWARFCVKIYRAEGLPTMEAGLMAKMSVTDRAVFIDPYVKVTFAGQQVYRLSNTNIIALKYLTIIFLYTVWY